MWKRITIRASVRITRTWLYFYGTLAQLDHRERKIQADLEENKLARNDERGKDSDEELIGTKHKIVIIVNLIKKPRRQLWLHAWITCFDYSQRKVTTRESLLLTRPCILSSVPFVDVQLSRQCFAGCPSDLEMYACLQIPVHLTTSLNLRILFPRLCQWCTSKFWWTESSHLLHLLLESWFYPVRLQCWCPTRTNVLEVIQAA